MRVRGRLIFLVALSAALGVARWLAAAPEQSSLRARTVAVIDGRRPFVLRLSGQTLWQSCDAPLALDSLGIRCENYLLTPTPDEEWMGIVRDAREKAHEQPVDAPWALVILDLLSGRVGIDALGSRIEDLESLVAVDSTNADLRNDLAVAYLARGDAWSAFLGLEQIERAYALDSTSSVVAFNRAFLLAKLHLSAEARLAWSSYVGGHREPGWATEALQRLRAVEARLEPRPFDGRPPMLVAETNRDPQHAREHAIDSLLPRWAHAMARGAVATADSACAAMVVIGSTLAAKSGDRSVTNVARVCGSPRRDVAEAALAFSDGNSHFRRGAFAPAGRTLTHASARLRRLGALPVADWADATRAYVDIYAGRNPVADSVLSAVERRAHARRDRALEARALWGRALSAARYGAKAIDYYARAAELYLRLGEVGNRALMVSQSADVQLLLGRDESAIRGKYEALSLFDRRRAARQRSGPFVALGSELVELGLPAAAAAVLREAVTVSSNSERPNDRPEALIQLADAEVAAGMERSGRVHLFEARAAFATITDTLMLQRQEMGAALVLASLDADSAPDVAIGHLTQVEQYYRRTNLHYNRGVPLARRGRLRWRRGDAAGARSDIDAAVEAIERQAIDGSDALAARDRAAAQREVYEALVLLDVDRSDTVAAFLTAERARGNRLERAPVLPPHHVVVSYFALPEKLLLWVVSDRGLRMHAAPVGIGQLRDRVRQAEALIRRGSDTPEWRAASRGLFDVLIEPALSEVEHARTLTIVTDGPLTRLPFGALLDSTGRYLTERVVLGYASATRATSVVEAIATAPVVVGHPSLDETLFPHLPALSGAVREVATVRRWYPKAIVLVDSTASRAAVILAMTSATLFHFAGHAQLVDRVPSSSHLVLAKSETEGFAENTLAAAEIARMNLRRMQLAILSSCGTSQRRSARDAGHSGLSEAFLSAGARAVISSRWEVDDAGTVELMELLHEELARGERPDLALHRAQRRVMRSSTIHRPLSVWAAFVYEGR
jgi:CHAT domain-containing protein